MTVIDLRHFAITAACQTAGMKAVDCHMAFVGPFGPEPFDLSAAEREEVGSILAQVAHSLAERTQTTLSSNRSGLVAWRLGSLHQLAKLLEQRRACKLLVLVALCVEDALKLFHAGVFSRARQFKRSL